MKKMIRKTILFGVGLIMMTGLTEAGNVAQKKTPSQGGLLLIPAQAAINLKEGTYETIFSLNYSFGDSLEMDPNMSESAGFWLISILDRKGNLYRNQPTTSTTKSSKPGPSLAVSIRQLRGVDQIAFGSNQFYVEATNPSGKERLYAFTYSPSKPDSPRVNSNAWHRFTMTWKTSGTTCQWAMYLDGRPLRTASMVVDPAAPNDFNPGDMLAIGNLYHSRGRIQSIRTSKSALTPEQVLEAQGDGMKENENTLLLLNDKNWSSLKIVSAEKYAEAQQSTTKLLTIAPKGTVVGNFQLTRDKTGEALQLYKKTR